LSAGYNIEWSTVAEDTPDNEPLYRDRSLQNETRVLKLHGAELKSWTPGRKIIWAQPQFAKSLDQLKSDCLEPFKRRGDESVAIFKRFVPSSIKLLFQKNNALSDPILLAARSRYESGN